MADHTIVLKQSEHNFARLFYQVVSPQDRIKFKTDGGEFVIIIRDAISIFNIAPDQDIKVVVNTSNPETDWYTVRNIEEDSELEYELFCISDPSIPDAPPKIIIIVNQ